MQYTPLICRYYLLVSAAGLSVIALGYGIAPTEVLPQILQITVSDRDLIHIFRAVMGLYLGFVVLWTAGAFVPRVAQAAILSEVVFMVGLASGRFLSLLIDGWPSILLTIYLILEATMAVIGIICLRKLSTSDY
jgi:hypothetical protein